MNRSSRRFMNKNINKVNIQKTKELHEEAIKYIEEHIELLKAAESSEKDIGLSWYILEMLKGLRKAFNKIG